MHSGSAERTASADASWIASPVRMRWTATSRAAASRTSAPIDTSATAAPDENRPSARSHRSPSTSTCASCAESSPSRCFRHSADATSTWDSADTTYGPDAPRTRSEEASSANSFTTADASAKVVTRLVHEKRARRHWSLRLLAPPLAPLTRGQAGDQRSVVEAPAIRPRQVAHADVLLRRRRGPDWSRRRRRATNTH